MPTDRTDQRCSRHGGCIECLSLVAESEHTPTVVTTSLLLLQ